MPAAKIKSQRTIRRRNTKKPIEVGKYLISDPEVYHAELTFKGTRIPVKTVLTFLAMGETIDALLEGYPRLSRDAIEEAVRLAKDALVAPYEKRTGRKSKCAARPSPFS